MHRLMSLVLLMEPYMLQPVNKTVLDYVKVKVNINTKLLYAVFKYIHTVMS